MVMEHFHERHSNPSSTKKVRAEWLKSVTARVDATEMSFAQRINAHWLAFQHVPGKLDRAETGQSFEAVVYDAVRHWGVTVTDICYQVKEGNNAEADLVLRDTSGQQWLVPLKTSLRERWAQIDRTFIIAEAEYKRRHRYGCHALFFSEKSFARDGKKTRKWESDSDLALRLEAMFYSNGSMTTTRDVGATDKWFHDEVLQCVCGAAPTKCLAEKVA